MMHTALSFAADCANFIHFRQDPNLLSLAIAASNKTLMHMLLDQHPDVDQKAHRISERTPFQNACSRGCDKALINRVLARSKTLSDPSGLGFELIRQACIGNSCEVEGLVVQLLGAGLDYNGASAEGMTALMLASQAGNVRLVKFLLTWSADPFAVDACGQSMLHYACWSKDAEVLLVLDQSSFY